MAIVVAELTQEQFDLLNTSDDWNIDEVPRDNWDKIPGLQRLNDTFAIMASGSSTDPTLMNLIKNVVAGMDVLTHESRPRPGEPEGNAYHYVFQYTGRSDYPYTVYGPYKSETVVPHWFNADDLDKYWSI